ncbi:MAG: hypothetical protein NT161_01415 [Candidatus Nomurabacteria bacterium]|nr:hypothetical protein [Candidatus Nomurabacteria bacterium]
MKKIYEDIKKVFESKISTRILIIIGVVIVAMLIFSAGIFVGFRKASFGRDWGENYERNFGMRSGGMMFGRNNFPNAHGAIGKIIKIELPTMIVQDTKDNTEKIILTKDDTRIQKMMSEITLNDLVINDYIVVIGSPNNQGQIEAKLIRVMPSPELMPGFKFLK